MVPCNKRTTVEEQYLVMAFSAKLFNLQPSMTPDASVKSSKWSSGSMGMLRIYQTIDREVKKHIICFEPNTTPFSNVQMSPYEQPGGINAGIHGEVAIRFTDNDCKSITFGKLALFSVTSGGKATRTIWCARFGEVGHAEAFYHLVRSMSQDANNDDLKHRNSCDEHDDKASENEEEGDDDCKTDYSDYYDEVNYKKRSTYGSRSNDDSYEQEEDRHAQEDDDDDDYEDDNDVAQSQPLFPTSFEM